MYWRENRREVRGSEQRDPTHERETKKQGRASGVLKSRFVAVDVASTEPQSTSLYFSSVSHLLLLSFVALSGATSVSFSALLLEAIHVGRNYLMEQLWTNSLKMQLLILGEQSDEEKPCLGRQLSHIGSGRSENENKQDRKRTQCSRNPANKGEG